MHIRKYKNKYRTKLIHAIGEIVSSDMRLMSEWESKNDTILWIDCDLSDEDELQYLLIKLSVHELAIKDLLRKKHPPKVEKFSKHLLILYRGLHTLESSFSFNYQDIGFLIGDRFLLSIHRGDVYSINHWFKNFEPTEYKPLAIASHIMLYSSGLYLGKIQDFENELSDIEDSFSAGSGESMMLTLSNSRSTLLRLKRIFNYHKQISSSLIEQSNSSELQMFPCDIHLLNDLNDRFLRIHSLLSMLYDICGDILNAYLSMSSHMLNNKIGILTMITAIFVPLSFLAGVYGMNFENMPELKNHYGYYFLLGLMGALSASMLMGFKVKKWF